MKASTTLSAVTRLAIASFSLFVSIAGDDWVTVAISAFLLTHVFLWLFVKALAVAGLWANRVDDEDFVELSRDEINEWDGIHEKYTHVMVEIDKSALPPLWFYVGWLSACVAAGILL